jgi:hypothetical protein
MRTSTAPIVDPVRARRVVEARLGRPPQDMLEAAVVLEAWAGMPAPGALVTAGALMARAGSPPPRPSVGRLPRPRPQDGVLTEGAAFMLCVVAIACWAGPLTDALGDAVVARGLTGALPVTIALQWLLRSRWLGRPLGAAQLAHLLGRLGVLAVVGTALAVLAFGAAGSLAAALTLVWTGGTILVARRRTLVHLVLVLAVTGLLLAGVSVAVALAVGAGATVVAVAEALRGLPAPAHPAAGGWARAATATALGGAIGLLLVLDDTVRWSDAAAPALLVPSVVAGFWGGLYLRHLEQAIPAAVRGLPAGARRSPAGPWGPLAVLGGAAGRLVASCVALSAVALMLAPWLRPAGSDDTGVLIGFGLIALATLLVGLAEALGRGRAALATLACAIAAEATVTGTSPGLGLIVGGGCAIAVLAPVVAVLLARPASTLATALWIP